MTREVQLEPGTWLAGYSAPFLVPEGAIKSKLQGFGLQQIQFFDRDAAKPPIDPHKDPHYSDDWDTWI
ncbi:MAG TPA: hypothetical protein VGQ57_09455, partial [Polyangiaceae bacterium]|nr:hypothetical protein [Polyangiaceae bacterium]